jgi:hypothetical protein
VKIIGDNECIKRNDTRQNKKMILPLSLLLASPSLHNIHLSKASVLSRRWMSSILTEKCTHSQYRTTCINQFETYYQDSFESGQPPFQCYAWEPEDTILCLIVVKPPFKVCHVVEHPKWNYDMYNSIHLKKALENEAMVRGDTIDFDILYSENPRYRLEWTYH